MLDKAATRQYSLCGDPDDLSRYRLGILRDPNGRGSSLYVHDQLKVGDTVRVRGPLKQLRTRPVPALPVHRRRNRDHPDAADDRQVAEAAGADWRLVYGGRQRSSMAFLDELAVHGDRVTVWPQDETGLLDLASVLGEPRPDTLIYCCGPEPLAGRGREGVHALAARALHLERFTAKPQGEPVRDEPFDVELAPHRYHPDRATATDRSSSIVEEAGVGVLSSCAEGTCGTCETGVLEGEPDHLDSVLTAEERKRQRLHDDLRLALVRRQARPGSVRVIEMEYRTFPATGDRLSVLGFGAMGFAGWFGRSTTPMRPVPSTLLWIWASTS